MDLFIQGQPDLQSKFYRMFLHRETLGKGRVGVWMIAFSLFFFVIAPIEVPAGYDTFCDCTYRSACWL